MPTITTIVFDIGNVLFAYEPKKVIDKLLPETPHHNNYLEGLYNHQVWQDLDRGDLEWQEAFEAIKKNGHVQDHQKEDINTLIHDFPYHITPIEETNKLYHFWLEHYPIYILSNFQNKPFDTLCKAHPMLNMAKGHIVSGKENMMKPEPEIYQLLLNRYKIHAPEALFIDDRKENIDAAIKENMQGIHYTTPEKLMEDLSQFDIRLP